MKLRVLQIRIPLRSQSTSASYQSPLSAASSLDLDFVLSLLDSSKGKGLSLSSQKQFQNKSDERIDLGQWSQMKFRAIECEKGKEKEKERGILINSIDTDINDTKRSIKLSEFKSFFSPTSPSVSSSIPIVNESETESTFLRLQNLADSLPTQIYDRHGNLIQLNSNKSSISFFDMLDTVPTSYHSSKLSLSPNLNAQNIRAMLPIFQRDNVDWKSVTLTSILKKIAPEEVFSDNAKVKLDQNDNNNIEITDDDDNFITEKKTTSSDKDKFKFKKVILNSSSSPSFASSITFDNVELRLLDVDQLHLLAKNLKVSINQTDCKIESEILKILKFNLKPENSIVNSALKTNKKLPKMSKEKVPWTAENETFLIDLYDELRTKKYQVDQKFSNYISQSQGISTTHNPNTIPTNHHPATPIKRGIGASSRGLWAVLSEKFKAYSRFHVSVTECRNKLIILKRLRS